MRQSLSVISYRCRGFSLIEVMIALLVLGVGFLGLAKLQSVVMLNSADSRMYSRGMVIAQDKIEAFRAYANRDSYDDFADGNEGSDIVGSNTVFNRSWTVANDTGNKQISVLVTWQAINGEQQEIRLTSNIAETEPARSGIVLAEIETEEISAAQIAAQAAAHAAAAARYEALVAASGAEDFRKLAAQEALDRANDAADAAQDAADNNNAQEAASQAALAQAAMNEIIDIINAILETSAPKFIDGNADPGTISVAMALGPTENGFCIMLDSDSYSCAVSTLENAVTIEGTRNDDERTSCVTLLTQGDADQIMFSGCFLSYAESCQAPWDSQQIVDEGNLIIAFESPSGLACNSQQRFCSGGMLDGSYNFESCTLLCTVPNYVGTKRNKIPDTWNSYNGSINNNISGNGNPRADSQSPSAGSTQSCTATLTVE